MVREEFDLCAVRGKDFGDIFRSEESVDESSDRSLCID